ncbi:MAG TPA: deoxyribodipyrimidine photo-lyase [Acidimicrobiales bacterium]
MSAPASAVVLWFRRDLRVADHPALLTAADEARARGRPVVPLFVVDDGLMAGAGANRRAYLARTLAALDDSLGGTLTLRRGRPEDVVPAVAAEVGASTVFATGDCAPYGRRRDARVVAALDDGGRTLARVGSPYAVSPGRVRSGAGGPFRVFTPFRHRWADLGWPGPSGPPTGFSWASAGSELAVTELDPDPSTVTAALPAAGERAAAGLLDRFLAGPAATYGDDRDRPDLDGTSRLSPHLRFGTLHPRTVLSRVPSGPSGETFRSELAWREFYADVLWHRPDSAWTSWSAVGAHLRSDTGPEADARFARWAEGRTGFPLVDAGMRQLRSEGWMHNRVRMIVATFLVKDLHLAWQRGAALFLELLVDGDLASNNHGWQWVAGTGTDAAPFHRVFNPDRQAERFDPDGAYVARYVAEFGTPAYPEPMVDHAAERVEALARLAEAREADAAGRPAGGAP